MKTKKIIFFTMLIITLAYQTINTSSFAQGVGINSDGSSPASSAILDIKSSASPYQGLLIPRLTTAQRDAISSPVESLFIFNTDSKCFEAFVNGAWNIGFCPAACTPPATPTANAASSMGCTSFTANWSASAGATSYFLDITTDAGFTSFVTGYNNLNVGNVQTQNIASLTAGTTYYYRVRAYNACASGNSNTITTTTSAAPASAPTAGTHTPSQTQIVWNWNTVSGATGYKYNTVNNYATATDNGASTTNTQTSLTCNTAYTLYVWAYNSCGNSAATSLTQTTSSCCTLIASAGSNQTTSCVVIGGAPTASGGTPGYTYAWNPSTGLSSSTVANPTASTAATTTYSVTVSDAGGCSASSSMTITITPTLLNNMVSYWKFYESSGNAADCVGSNTLTNNNTATYSAGKINNGATLSGSNSLLITDASQTGLGITGDISISFWIYLTARPANSTRYIIVGKSNTSFNGYEIVYDVNAGYDGSSSRLMFASPTSNSTYAWAQQYRQDIPGDNMIPLNGWHHIIATRVASTGALAIYLDGTSVASSTGATGNISTNTASFGSGGIAGDTNGGYYTTVGFVGSLDEVGIWSRALSACEVSTLYNSGNGLQYPF